MLLNIIFFFFILKVQFQGSWFLSGPYQIIRSKKVRKEGYYKKNLKNVNCKS